MNDSVLHGPSRSMKLVTVVAPTVPPLPLSRNCPISLREDVTLFALAHVAAEKQNASVPAYKLNVLRKRDEVDPLEMLLLGSHIFPGAPWVSNTSNSTNAYCFITSPRSDAEVIRAIAELPPNSEINFFGASFEFRIVEISVINCCFN